MLNIENIFPDSTAEILKGGKPAAIGEIREFGGKKYKKQANGKWLEVSEHGMTKKHYEEKLERIRFNDQHGQSSTKEQSELGHIHTNIKKLSDKEHSDEEVGLKISDSGSEKEENNFTKKTSNSVIHDINGTKVTVSKNNDGSYTLEANGKKFRCDDPSFFAFGTNLKPRVKKMLAKRVGID